jgi:hypothetical protein
MTGKTKLVLGLTILLLAGIIGALVYACSIEGPNEVSLDYYSGVPAIVIGHPLRFVADSIDQVRYVDFEVKEWIKGNRTDVTIRLKKNWNLSSCDLLEFFRDTTTYYFLPLHYYNYNLGLGPTIDSSWLTIPYWPDAFWWGEYKFFTRDSIPTFSEVSIIRHIIDTKSHPFRISLSTSDTVFVPGKPLLTRVTVKNITSYQLVVPDSSKIDFHVDIYDSVRKIDSLEGKKRETWRERIWWLPYEKENLLKLKSGESISYIIDLSQRFPELSSFSYGSQRTLKVNALLNYYLIPLYGHSVRTDTLALPFGIVASVELGNVPIAYRLFQNYPNPFNPSTTISYDLPTRSHVTLRIFNVLGQEVATLVNGQVEAGRHTVHWNAGRLASGVYFCRMTASDHLSIRKLIMTK